MVTQTGQEEVLSKLNECWNEILHREVPAGSTEKWRWKWDKDKEEPVRFRLPMTQPRVKLKNGRWYLIQQKMEREIMVDSTVPQRVLADWKRRGNLNPEQWERAFLKKKTGINRAHLRLLINILKTANIAPLPTLRRSELTSELIPLQQTSEQNAGAGQTSSPQEGSTEPMTSNQLEHSIAMRPAVTISHPYWTTGLQVSKSWNSKPRPLPSVSADDRELIRKATYAIKSGKQMVFITGAGISVAANIPDFRSKDGLLKSKRKDAFGSSALTTRQGNEEHNKAMGDVAEKAQLASANPTNWHHLQAHLAERKDQPALRIYTQNIDGIEDSFLFTKVQNPKTDALDPDIVVYLHGNLRWARCRKCDHYEILHPELYQMNTSVQCPKCIRRNRNNRRLKNLEVVTLQPNVVLYDALDDNPNQSEKDRIITVDLGNKIQRDPNKVNSKHNFPSKAQALPDRLVVCGTSASLPEIAAMIGDFAEVVHQTEGGQVVWIGLSEPPGKIRKYFDEVFLLDCQDVASYYFEDVDFSDGC